MPMLRDHCPVTRAVAGGVEPPVLDERVGNEVGQQALLLRGSPFALEAGLRLVFTEDDHAVVTLPIHRGAGTEPGKAHPGAITALVEAAAAAAAGQSPGGLGTGVSGISVNFVRPGSDRPLVAEARVLGGDGAFRSFEVDVSDWNGTLVAKGFVTYEAGGGKGGSRRCRGTHGKGGSG
jgi:uncharacterized protein (TIGR00369 family)